MQVSVICCLTQQELIYCKILIIEGMQVSSQQPKPIYCQILDIEGGYQSSNAASNTSMSTNTTRV